MKTGIITVLLLQLILICSGQNVLQCPRIRVFFEIDTSLSVTQDNLNDEISLVRSSINGIRHSTGSEAGFVSFNSDVILGSLSATSADLSLQLSRLNNLALSTNATSFTNALTYANDVVFTQLSPGTSPRNILILLTDGEDVSADNNALDALSQSLTVDKETTVIVVAFGSATNLIQLRAIVSASNDSNILMFGTSRDAADNFQLVFTQTGICISVPLTAPTNPMVTLREPRSLTISWTRATSPVTSYRVCYTTNLNADLTSVCNTFVNTPFDANQQSITDLIPFTQYRYAVFSINNNLELGSSLNNEQTLQTGSSVPVRSLSAAVNSYNSATVTWLIPLLVGRNGIITSYEICYLAAGVEACAPLVLVGAASLTNTVTTLVANTNYIVRVTPISSEATQERGMANEVSFTTPRFPAIVLVTAVATSATEIRVTWTAPSFSVNSYQLSANEILVTPSASNVIFTITGATPFTEYTVSIVGLTNNGLTLQSNTLLVRTLEAAPFGQVQSLTAIGFSPTSIQVDFTEPPMNLWNGILVSYFICVRNLQEARCVQSARVPYASSISIVIPGLISDTQYNVSVVAINGVGRGPEISTLTTTPAADISPVFNLEGRQTGARQISITWENPPEALDSSLVGGIRVCYGMAGIDCQFQSDLLPTETSYNITLPEPINPYFIAVSLTTPTGSRGVADTILVSIYIVEVSSLRTDAVSSSEIVVAWTAPVVPLQFTLLSYAVYVRSVVQTGFVRSFSPDNMTLTIVVEGLNPNTQYETIVAPVIQEDFFIRNQTSLATTFLTSPVAAPFSVSVDFALSTALRISWTQPLMLISTTVTYEVTYVGTVLDPVVRQVNATGLSLFRTLIGLEEAETYLISVKAVYAGISAESVRVEGTTLEDVPSSPATNVVAVTTDDYVEVSWTHPTLLDRNGILSSYYIICTYSASRNTSNTVDGVATSVRLYDLDAGTSCNITVIAFTQEGAGPPSNAVTAATQAPLNVGELCNGFRISLSVITIIAAAFLVTIVALIAVLVIHYFRNHHSPLPAPGIELYANPKRV